MEERDVFWQRSTPQMPLFVPVLAVALLWTAGAMPASAQDCSATDRASAEQAYSTAYQFVSNNQWAEAVPSLEEAMERCPTHWPSLELLAQAKMRLKDYPAAAKRFGELIEGQYEGRIGAAEPRVLEPYGYVLLQSQDWETAELVYQTILVQDPYNYKAHDRLVYRFEKDGKTEQAITHLETMYDLASDEDKSKVAQRLGDAYKKTGDQETAAEWYSMAGGATSGMFTIGVDQMRTKDWQGAIESFKTYLEGKPNSIPALKNLGQCYQALKKSDQAIAHYEKALGIDAKRHDIASSLGLLYDETGQWSKAGPIAQDAIENWPRDDEKLGSMYYLMGRVKEKRDSDYEGAIAMFEQALDDPYWGRFARDEIQRQRQLIEIRDLKARQGGR